MPSTEAAWIATSVILSPAPRRPSTARAAPPASCTRKVIASEAASSGATRNTNPMSISLPRRNGRWSSTPKAVLTELRTAVITPLAVQSRPSRPTRPSAPKPLSEPCSSSAISRAFSPSRPMRPTTASMTSSRTVVSSTNRPAQATTTIASGKSENRT